MWVEPRQELPMTMGRSSGGSDVVMIDSGMHMQPAANNVNVNNSTRVHIGPKFVSVTQNVDNVEVVKGRILGLELVSPQNTKRLRCSIAVFVCWAFVVACALTFIIFHYAFAKQVFRLDLDLPFYRYVWDVAKNTTKAERLSSVAALVVLVICIILIVYFTTTAKRIPTVPSDVAPHEWYITREMWLGQDYNYTQYTDAFEPLSLVIIAHTVGPECHVFANCAAEMRTLQDYYILDKGYDLPYNFMIGNDGRVYEGRGWNIVGAHTRGYNNCSLGVAFFGDYREDQPNNSKVSNLQLQRANMLFDKGVRMGYLDQNFQVVGAKDLDKTSLSPGTNLYNRIRQWSNYAHDNVFLNRSCHEIKELFENRNTTTTTIATTVDDKKNN